VKASCHDWIVTLDGDGQNDPADIPRLLAAAARHPVPDRVQMVAGQRRRRADTWLRRFSSRVANATRGRLLGDRTPDTGCGLKLIRREAFLDLPYFDHVHRFLPRWCSGRAARSCSWKSITGRGSAAGPTTASATASGWVSWTCWRAVAETALPPDKHRGRVLT